MVMDTWISLRIDCRAFRVSSDMLNHLLNKLRKGKDSPDGVTAEMCALPEDAKVALAEFFTKLLASLVIPGSWTTVRSRLIPKFIGGTDLDSFRAIACLPAARKLLGYVWLKMLPELNFDSFQTGFVAGSQAADGVYVLKRAAELSREWKRELHVVQLDLSKAFDRVKQDKLLECLGVWVSQASLSKQSLVFIRIQHSQYE